MHDLFMMNIRFFLLAVYSMDETPVIGFVQFYVLYHTVCDVVYPSLKRSPYLTPYEKLVDISINSVIFYSYPFKTPVGEMICE
jgi:hypothetical protein